ncbi:disintegrin and metalloproteinase domain-containing protein 9-like isoform X5 [Daphnia carinata]|uniref:disintegrin and metalloproteinase domain-containing protein 9-like isoform X5 n=1 Tax=Daphnia carinata TaxID=120202 RepID=UPI002869708D|nr:disintegrin and metalloproteinase domain-containing protein 9-like isoform X5 [Daphnia carinata]
MTKMSRILPLLLFVFLVNGQIPKRDSSDTLDDSFWTEETSVGDVEKLLKEHRENQDLVRSIGGSHYQIVFPVQLRHREKMGISTREIGATKTMERPSEASRMNERYSTQQQQTGKHYHRTSLLIKAFSHKFRLDLELNSQLLAPNLIQKHFLPGGVEQFSKQEIEHCYYHGTVNEYYGAVAAFRTCSGVSGIIHIGNETFVIHPFYGGDLSRNHPHVIFEARTTVKQMCANTGMLEWGLRSGNYRGGKNQKNSPKSNERQKRDVREVTKYVETALVLDKAMFEKRNGSRRIEVVQDAIQIANIADLYFRTLNTRVSVVYIETWASENQAPVDRSQDIHRALLNFNDYISRKLYKVDKDTTQLLSGETFAGGSGMAAPDTMCTAKSVGLSVDINPYEPHLVAGTMAHMIGHNIGMGHDDGRDECHCGDWHGCIMSQSIMGLDSVQPYKFSECSLSDYIDSLRIGHGICLFNRPNQLEDFRTCGNGVVEDGEECDCGTIEECHESDPCCDPITCKLTAEAECASGPCCDDCKLRPKGYLCRDATNECDLPEICNGRSGQCPLDIFKKNGNQCEINKGYCFNGVCPTLDSQCRLIWGDGGLSGDRKCFEQFNSQGSINGHCGLDSHNNYIRCDAEHVMCGSLQCQMGTRYPIVAGMDQMYSRTLVSMAGREFECKITSGTVAAADLPDLGIVRDGTPCGNNLICINKTCSSIYPYIDRSKCPSNNVALDCSGHGVCSNVNSCFCDAGWTGHDCSTQTNDSYIRSGHSGDKSGLGAAEASERDASHAGALGTGAPPLNGVTTLKPEAQTSNSKTTSYVDRSGHSTVFMVVMLVSVVGGVFIVFALMALCYRRKSTMPKYDPPYLKRPLVNASGQMMTLPKPPGSGGGNPGGGAGPSGMGGASGPSGINNATANHHHTTSMSNDALSLEAGAKGISFGTMPSYNNRFPGPGNAQLQQHQHHIHQQHQQQQHIVQHMKQRQHPHMDGISSASHSHVNSPNSTPAHHGISNHIMQASASEDETLQSGEDEGTAFLDGMPQSNNLSGSGINKQPEKGILKKSGGGVYGSVGGGGGISSSQQQLAGGGGHGPLLTLPLGRMNSGSSMMMNKEKWSEESQSDNQEVMSVLLSPDGGSSRISDRLGASSLSDVERTLKSLNGYHEDILQALRSAAASQRSASTASLSDELRKSFAESYADYFPPPDYLSMRSLNNHDKHGGGRGGVLGPGSSVSSTSERLPGLASPLPGGGPLGVGAHGGGDSGDEGDLVPPCGPIRIRNLEDLIRQLERHSARHTSPNGSEDIRMSETEADRHYRLMEAAAGGGVPGLGASDPQSGSDALRFVYGRYRQPTSVPGISLYETTNENNHDHDDIKHGGHGSGDPGDSDESDSDVVLGADQERLFIDDPLLLSRGGPEELGYGPPLSPSGNSEASYTVDDGTTTVSSSYPSGSRSAVSAEESHRVAAADVEVIAASPHIRPAKFPEYKH